MSEAPENTLTVEIWDATGTILLGSRTSQRGLIAINGSGRDYGSDFLIHFSGPAAVEYNYRFSIGVQNADGEDECEC